MKTNTVNEQSALAATIESVEQQKTAPDNKAPDNSTRPLNVTAPSGLISEPAPTTAAAAAAPPKPDSPSIPSQIAREHIASGKVIEPLPEPTARGKGQRVAAAARDVVEERLAPRVEKLRQASNVVWSEAQDDPNLRFILVAVFLFILALVIILLGTYLR
jgi:hypothetical protein